MWVFVQHACVFGHVTKIPNIKAVAWVFQLIIESNTMQGMEKPPETDTYKAL